ncbi:MAG: hypothetical protein PHS32_12340 [Rhodoferax sp.]|uniref:glycine zipper 2TM domain-containing protein n=1 Tax=Rhodoferax sp. TaxID=50421 RepID=UPI0026353A51|nr:hypothetical protein [Rhodoferax sp.]MDD5334521.1 hypothetical protein [Rhodoferax sp.]
MKKILLLSVAMMSGGLVWAQDTGRVISATPVVGQVAVPRQVCGTEQVVVQQPKSGAGAVVGAIAGGAIGNAIGAGAGQAAATVLGIMGGAIVGDKVEGASPAQSQNVQRCSMQTFYETRPLAYNVVYEFAGKQYSVQMPNDPGPTVRLQISPVGMSAPPEAPAPSTAYVAPEYIQTPPVIVVQGDYPRYYYQPFYPAIAIGLGLGYWGGYWRGHGGRHHWR